MDLTPKGFLKFTFLPGIAPRLRDLMASGFRYIAMFTALVYRVVGLLPAGHPYLNPENFGRYGLHNVVFQAASNLKFDRKHIDQVVIFFILLLGFVLLAMQFGLLAGAFFIGSAKAAGAMPTDFVGWFTPADPTNDLAYVLLDRVFGVPGLFGSCVEQNIACFGSSVSDGPWPFAYHGAMQNMFALYSEALLIVATIIVGYLIVTIVMETAETGTPFGRRFNRVWAPLRLVAGLGLLLPVSYGLNSAQYITLYAAKWGSGFATNGWNRFVDNISAPTLLGEPNSLTSIPEFPPMPQDIYQFFTVVSTCVDAYRTMYGREIQAYMVRNTSNTPSYMLLDDMYNNPMTVQQIAEWTRGDMVIRYGEYNPELYPNEKGYVFPHCGEMNFKIMSQGAPSITTGTTLATESPVDLITRNYINNIILFGWEDIKNQSTGTDFVWIGDWARNINRRYLPQNRDPNAPMPTEEQKQFIMTDYRYWIEESLREAYAEMGNYPWAEDAKIYGWGGAAIWYNKIAQVNGDLTAAVFNLPQPTKFPDIMEQIQAGHRKEDSAITGSKRFEPHHSSNKLVELPDPSQYPIAQAMYQAFVAWNNTTYGCGDSSYGAISSDIGCGRRPATGNQVMDFIYVLFGLEGLWDMRRNEHVYPLAQLASLGRAMVEHGVTVLGYSAGSGILGLVTSGTMVGGMGKAVSGFLLGIGMIGLSIGLVLFYVIPFMPFLYFFFAVGGWVKGVFEAMVGVPLWALAHLKIDGEGLPGRAAMNGYYLLLEVFIRPILIVFGLVASIVVFYAMVRTLNNMFDIVVSNLAGFNHTNAQAVAANSTGSIAYYRGIIDQFFYTILYALVVYMIAQSTFKLIDLIPKSILRWMHGSVESFGDQLQPAAENLTRNAFLGTNSVFSSGGSIIGQMTGRGAGWGENAAGRI
ncbi:DotA/TraY family protein [Micavibrio aeruginosavorus]|uniref:DotA/TraY family protein n=1 Tax=Micavibrio aeruginosavorus TaxID=349221 RepID=UPI003F4AC299